MKGHNKHFWNEEQMISAARFYANSVPGVTLKVTSAMYGIPASTLSWYFNRKLSGVNPQLSEKVQAHKKANFLNRSFGRRNCLFEYVVTPFGINGIGWVLNPAPNGCTNLREMGNRVKPVCPLFLILTEKSNIPYST